MNQPALIAKKSDILHKVEMGILFDIYYDTETTDLSKRFAEITQFGGAITDLAGNILHTVDLRAKVSPYTVISPYAWLVQRLRLEDLNKGDPLPLFMGKVKKFFEYDRNLSTAPFAPLFLSSCRTGTFTNERGEKEQYHSYPVQNNDGTIDWDFLRVHEKLKKFYFKDEQSGQWVKRDIKSMTIGYNNINADDQWLWTAAHMAGADNIFMTHLSQKGKLRLDALRVVEAAIIAGSTGGNALQPAMRQDKRTGETFMSFSQGSILEVNTRRSSELRGITEGIVREDGSYVDLSQLHGALADSLSLLALMRYIRKTHPDILKQMERNTDWKYVVEKLTDVKESFGNNPPLAYVDKTFPTVDGKMISLIGTDQYRNAPKVAVVWNLGIDPNTYTYNGKSIEQLSAFDWKQILEDSKSNPNAPLKVIRAHKSPRIFDAATGYAAGFNLGLDRTEIHGRVSYIRKSKIVNDVMSGLRLAFPRLHGTDRVILPQPEEELFTFSTLELFDGKLGEDVQVHHRIQNKVEEIAQKSRAHIMQIKSLWLKAVFCDEDILLGMSQSPKEFMQKVKDINKELTKRDAITLPEPDAPIEDRESALQYKIKILFYARNHFSTGRVQDIGHHFWFEDQKGIRYSDKDVRAWPQHQIDDAIKAGELNICHEQIHTTPLIIDRIIESLGFAHILGPDINKQLDAYKTLRQTGIPHYHGQQDRWNTVSHALKDIAKIETNELVREDLGAIDDYMPGAWETFMDGHHDRLASLSECKQYLHQLVHNKLSPENMLHVGIDPASGYPIKNYDFSVNLEKTLIINVPDRYLDHPTYDPVQKRPVWILPLQENFQKATHDKSISVLFRAAGTGRLYHFPTAQRVHVPNRSGIYNDFYNAVGNAYDISGQEMPPAQKSMALIGNGPYPLFDLRTTSEHAQSIHVPTHMFEGMVAPQLSGYKVAPRGVIIRDDGLQIDLGSIRLQEVSGDQLTGWEYETDVAEIKNITLEDIKNLSAYDLTKFGFGTVDEAIDCFSSLFTSQNKDPQDSKNKAMAIVFGTINPDHPKRGMMFYKPDAQVMSCVQHHNSLEGPE